MNHANAPADLHVEELGGQRVVAPAVLGNAGAGLGKAGVIQGQDHRSRRREGFEPLGEHWAEQVPDAPASPVERLVVRRPVLLLQSLEGDGVGDRAPAMARQEAQERPGDPLKGAQLLEGRPPKPDVGLESLQHPHKTSGNFRPSHRTESSFLRAEPVTRPETSIPGGYLRKPSAKDLREWFLVR
jgi:hypothetical protein